MFIITRKNLYGGLKSQCEGVGYWFHALKGMAKLNNFFMHSLKNIMNGTLPNTCGCLTNKRK